jgi:hypothetical protein
MMPKEVGPTEGISRRKMLKRIGAGAAVAWSAPILTSIRTPAFAQYDNPCPDTGCPGELFEPCTGNPPGCQTGSCTENLGCFKGDDFEGRCHCYQNIFCSCVQACNSSADCGPRQFCMPNTGCGGSACINCCGEGCRDEPGLSRLKGATVRG